jgi:hypothetical protein
MNFLCISNYNNDLDWLREYPNPHLIYDKTWNGGVLDNDNSVELPPSNLKEKYPDFNIINGSQNGYNINDYLTFIIDNYDNLPEVTVFIKANIIGRHVGKNYFDKVINNKTFTPLVDWSEHEEDKTSFLKTKHMDSLVVILIGYSMWSCEGLLMELNDSWYLRHPKHPSKYFRDYNDFLKLCYKNPILPKYISFPPGGNYIVPKEYILKYDKVFYQNLKKFVDYERVPGEGQMIERALYTIWTCNYEVSDVMKKLI